MTTLEDHMTELKNRLHPKYFKDDSILLEDFRILVDFEELKRLQSEVKELYGKLPEEEFEEIKRRVLYLSCAMEAQYDVDWLGAHIEEYERDPDGIKKKYQENFLLGEFIPFIGKERHEKRMGKQFGTEREKKIEVNRNVECTYGLPDSGLEYVTEDQVYYQLANSGRAARRKKMAFGAYHVLAGFAAICAMLSAPELVNVLCSYFSK